MAVLLELSIFSISGEISKRKEVANVILALRNAGFEPKLEAMGTLIEAKDMDVALQAISIASKAIDAQRYYVIAKFDCYPQREEMIEGRVKRVLDEIE